MARNFVGTVSTFLSFTDTGMPSGSAAFTVSMIIRAATGGVQIGWGTSGGNFIACAIDVTGGHPRLTTLNAGINASGANVLDGLAHSLVYAFGSGSCSFYIDGVAAGSGSLAVNTTLFGTGMIGGGGGSPNSNLYYTGDIAELAVYNVKLTADKAAMLAKITPLKVQAENLVRYWPLLGVTSPEQELVKSFGATVTGATASTHPNVSRPHNRKIAAVDPPPRSMPIFHRPIRVISRSRYT